MTLLLLVCMLLGCQSNESSQANSAQITVFNKTLDDMSGVQEEIDLVKDFPFTDYKIYKVRSIGAFYVDNRSDLIKNGVKRGYVWEKPFVDIMEQRVRPGSTVVDIGAHIGIHTLSMSRLAGEAGVVVAFEPQLKIYSELINNIVLNNKNNIVAYRCALGNKRASVEMNPPVADNEGATSLGSGGDSVEMITLDSLKLDDVSFIKIDVENFEYEVLLGAKETIARNKPYMIVEIMGNSYLPVMNRKEREEETKKLIESMGYKLEFIEGSWSDWLATPL